jgi:mono/diheme cytochrome c family protein
VFLNQGTCATCHTLADAQSNGMIGPNLNEIRPLKDQVLSSVTRGIGVMPAFDGILSSEEIDAVSHYVAIAANQ